MNSDGASSLFFFVFWFAFYIIYKLIKKIEDDGEFPSTGYYWISLVSVWFLGLVLFFRFNELNGSIEPEGQTIFITGILAFILLPSSIAAGVTAIISDSIEIAVLSWFVYSFLQVAILGFISNQLRDSTLAMMQLSLPSLELLNALFRILRLII